MKEDMIIQLIKGLNNIKLYFGKLLPYIIYSMFIILVIIIISIIIRYTGFGNETIFETFIIKPTRSILDYKVHCLVPSMKPGLEPDDYEAANFMFVQFLFIDPKIYEESLISFIKKSTTTDRHIS